MTIIKYKCGLCKEKNRIAMTRKGLRKHLREEHRIMSDITNKTDSKGKKQKQSFWIEEEI